MSKARRIQARHRASECISQVSRHCETGRGAEPPDSHSVVVEQPAVEPKEETPDDMRVSFEEGLTDLPCSRRQCPRDQTRASQLAGTLLLHNFLMIRIVKSVSSIETT